MIDKISVTISLTHQPWFLVIPFFGFTTLPGCCFESYSNLNLQCTKN